MSMYIHTRKAPVMNPSMLILGMSLAPSNSLMAIWSGVLGMLAELILMKDSRVDNATGGTTMSFLTIERSQSRTCQ